MRAPIEKDRRRFVPLPRTLPKAEKIYKLRSASERFFSRLKHGFGSDNHYTRGLAKMKVKTGISMITVLALAIGAIALDIPDKMRSCNWQFRGPPSQRIALPVAA